MDNVRDGSLRSKSMAALMGDLNPLVAVVQIDYVEHAERLAETLVMAGIKIIEVTLRSDCAVEALRRIVALDTGAMVGAGTITKPEQMSEVEQAGAQFGVSPASTPLLMKAADRSRLPFLLGVATPTEALSARENGFTELKFFPADLMGGPGWLSHILPLYPDLTFCPTGRMNHENFGKFLALDNVFAVGGPFLAPREMIAAGNWDGIAAAGKRAVSMLSEIG